jgi:hypothetical protein
LAAGTIGVLTAGTIGVFAAGANGVLAAGTVGVFAAGAIGVFAAGALALPPRFGTGGAFNAAARSASSSRGIAFTTVSAL